MPFATITVHTGATTTTQQFELTADSGGPSVTLSGAEFPTIGTRSAVVIQFHDADWMSEDLSGS